MTHDAPNPDMPFYRELERSSAASGTGVPPASETPALSAARCEKCGSDDLHCAWHKATRFSGGDCNYGSYDTSKREHLHYHCRYCRYDWTAPTLDQIQAAVYTTPEPSGGGDPVPSGLEDPAFDDVQGHGEGRLKPAGLREDVGGDGP